MAAELYQQITDEIIAAVEAGIGKFHLPWYSPAAAGTPRNAISGRRYHGINTLLLWVEAFRRSYATGEWATYRQWTAAGAQVRKGEQATLVLLWKQVARAPEAHDDDQRERSRLIARAFHVFNADQVDGYTPSRTPLSQETRIAAAETLFAQQPATVRHGGAAAFYDRENDAISLPAFESFATPEAYCSVYAHELTHWTEAEERLNRDLSGRFGSEAYAMEELIAELGAAFTLGHLALAASPRDDHASYIANWLRVLRNDARAIVTAASRAQAATDYLIAHATGGSDAVPGCAAQGAAA